MDKRFTKNPKDPLELVSNINIDFSKSPPTLSVYSKNGKVLFSASVEDVDVREIRQFIASSLQAKR